MDIAVKFGFLSDQPILTQDGSINLESGQGSVAGRLLDMYPGARLIAPKLARGNGFEVVTLSSIDANSTIVVNLDVLDSVCVFQRLHRSGAEPKIVNFQWVNPTVFNHPVNFGAMGLSYAFFPTFCAGERTAGEVREVLERWAPPEYVHRARIAWADLGVGISREMDHAEGGEPVVLYPAITMDARKQPGQFMKIVTAAHKRAPFKVVARLAQSHLVTDQAMDLAHLEWANVGPLRSDRDDYWNELAHTTAFLATSREEAYGLAYVEALLAGVIGIFPDLPWARRLLPDGYPFLYSDRGQAEDMLVRAVTDPAGCRAQLDQLAGGSFVQWVRLNHDRRDFEDVFTAQLREWFS